VLLAELDGSLATVNFGEFLFYEVRRMDSISGLQARRVIC
jgi:hypothetical protein